MLLVNIVKQSFMLIAGAFVGGLLILVLPYAWIVAGLVMASKMLFDKMVAAVESNAGFGWRPLQGYLTGRKEKRKSRDSK